MSNPNDKDRDQEHEDALKALHGMGERNSDEESVEDAEAQEETQEESAELNDTGPSPSASGFVGMLAKQGKEGNGGLDASEPAPPADASATAEPKPAGTDRIYMAKEIKDPATLAATPLPTTPAPAPASTAPAAAPAKSTRRVRQAPGWYHAAIPVMYTLSIILLIIGFWAVGALIYMATVKPQGVTVGYWFLYAAEDMDAAEIGTFIYTPGSRLVAWTMLMCIPVSLALGIMAGIMQRHIRMTQEK